MAIELRGVGQMIQSADSQLSAQLVLSALIAFFGLLLLVLLTIASSVSKNCMIIMHPKYFYRHYNV